MAPALRGAGFLAYNIHVKNMVIKNQNLVIDNQNIL